MAVATVAGAVSDSSLLQSLESLGIAEHIRQSLYWFPTLEAVHVIALGLVFGTILVVDLRILGIASTARPFTRVSGDMLRWTWAAFVLAAITGSLMFVTNARVYWENGFFRAKLILIALAGLNMLVFHFTAGRSREWDTARRGPPVGVACAAVSMTLWVLVIGMGRTIGFTTTGAAAKEEPATPNVDFDSFLGGDASAPAPGGAGAQAATTSAGGAGAATSAGAAGVPASVPAALSIQEVMDQQINPAGEFLFRSIREVSDDKGHRLEAPATDAAWAQVREELNVLRRAPDVLGTRGIKAAPAGFKAENPGVESEPAEIQAAVDSNRADFDRRAVRLRDAADNAMKAADAKDPRALMRALDGIDKACESCHLRYFYPRDQRAQLQAKEDHVEN
ncbi:MAG TPA: DUF6644 family protein [Steroidobacteraceae bacterium]|jgi:hypothetical protein